MCVLKDLVIRYARPEDMRQVIGLCYDHAKYESAEISNEVNWCALSEHLFVIQDVKCLVAELRNEIVGFATFMKQFSTWDAAFYIYMDCLYLKEEARGKGIGQQMIKEITVYAKDQGCRLMQWQTPDFNEQAIRFYEKIGAASKSKRRFFLKV